MTAYSFAATANSDVPWDRRISVVGCLGDQPMDLMTLPMDPPGGTPTSEAPPEPATRSTMGSRWRERFDWPRMQLVQAPGPGGPIETWIASPADAAGRAAPDDRRHPRWAARRLGPGAVRRGRPALCAPATAWSCRTSAARRATGATGSGRTSGTGASVDAEDVHAALDHAIALGLADPDRLGALGLSYGGFMVNWLLGTSNRFRAGISDGGVTNQVSDWAQSDSGVDFNRWALLGAPLDPGGVDALWRMSPLANVANIRTPLLILQGEEDKRCPPSDNEQLFVALRVLGRTVEYVLYPEESHVYFTSGRPDRRIDRMTRMLDWFDRYVR